MKRVAIVVLAVAAALVLAAPASAARPFPKDFLWGTASAGFQSEAGGAPARVDRRSDWYQLINDPGLIADDAVSGDPIASGPGFLNAWRGALDRADRDRTACLARRAPSPRCGRRPAGGPSLPADPPRRSRAGPAGDADAEPLHAADLDRRPRGGPRQVRGPRPRRAGPAGTAQGRLAEPLDGRRVPQVRRLRRLEVPPSGEALGDAERAADHGLAGLRLDPRRDRGEGAGHPLLHGGTASDEHARPRQRGRLRRDP